MTSQRIHELQSNVELRTWKVNGMFIRVSKLSNRNANQDNLEYTKARALLGQFQMNVIATKRKVIKISCICRIKAIACLPTAFKAYLKQITGLEVCECG